MRTRTRSLMNFLFGQHHNHVVQHVRHEHHIMAGGSGAPIQYGARGMCEAAQQEYLAWVDSLPELTSK